MKTQMQIRKSIFTAVFAAFSVISYSQSNNSIEISAVDSISIENAADSLAVIALDTVNTADKYVKIVIWSNHTWEYIDYGRPQIDDEAIEGDEWNTSKIHAYKGLNIASLPDSVDFLLVDSLHGYCAPITGTVRSGYQFRRTREHRGTDIPLTVGDPIRAAFDGKVRIVMTTSNTGGYGNLVVIRHPNGLETYYGHLSKHAVAENDIVKAGEIIGYGGNTGRSTGPRLPFETRYMGQAFDPERLIDFKTGELRDTIFTLKKHYLSIYSHYGQTDEQSIEASKRKIHVVRSGDTLSGIAVKYGTTVSRICKLNGFSSKKILRVGQRIIVR